MVETTHHQQQQQRPAAAGCPPPEAFPPQVALPTNSSSSSSSNDQEAVVTTTTFEHMNHGSANNNNDNNNNDDDDLHKKTRQQRRRRQQLEESFVKAVTYKHDDDDDDDNHKIPSTEDVPFAVATEVNVVQVDDASSSSTTTTTTEIFERGDHVYQWCSFLGIPRAFQHHGIVIHVQDIPSRGGNDDDSKVEQLLTIADFSNLLWGGNSSSKASGDRNSNNGDDETYDDDDDDDDDSRDMISLSSQQQHQDEGHSADFRSKPAPTTTRSSGSTPFLQSGSSSMPNSSKPASLIEQHPTTANSCFRVYTTTSSKDCQWHKVEYRDNWFHTHIWKRSGTCTPATSDPPEVVMKRVNFLLSQSRKQQQLFRDGQPNHHHHRNTNTMRVEEDANHRHHDDFCLLPNYHSIFANCECVAVWCKTGTWSTLQAASFLSHAFVGQAKGTATIAGLAAAQTVTVPASGVLGWLGYTTTVPLMTMQPLLLPAICAYGAVTVGGPAVCLVMAKSKWRKTTDRLNSALEAECLEVSLVT